MMIDDKQIRLINDVIDVNDRGLAYGDGLFETIAFVNGVLHNWYLHWRRLCIGAERLCLEMPSEQFLLNNITLKLTQNNDLDENDQLNDKVIKIIISRGVGGRGYQFPQQAQASLIISVHHWPQRADSDYLSGIKITVCQTCLAQQPALAGVKHLNRLEQVLARNEFNAGDFHDGLMLACSENNAVLNANIIEATSSNLFFVKSEQLFTPKIDTCGVQGTIRQEILQLAKSMTIHLEQDHYILADLSDASEVFLTNSIFGVVPVASITIGTGIQWFYSQENKQRISAILSSKINPALNRPKLL